MPITNSSNKSDIIHSFICAMVVFCAMCYSPPDTAFTLNVRCDGAETGAASPDGFVHSDSNSQRKAPDFVTKSTKKDTLGSFDIVKTSLAPDFVLCGTLFATCRE